MKKEKKDKRMTRGMLALYLLLTLVGGVAVVWNIVDIQFSTHEKVDKDGKTRQWTWREKGEKRESKVQIDTARRGDIYSSDGKILATTVKVCDFYLDLCKDTLKDDYGMPLRDKQGNVKQAGPIVDSAFNKYLDTMCHILSEGSRIHNAAYYRDKVMAERNKKRPGRCALVARRIPYSTWLAISRLPGWGGGVVRQVDGRSVIRLVRAHIYDNMAANTIGFANEEASGTYTGLEGVYDSILKGSDGCFTCRRLTRGIWKPDVPREGARVPERTDMDQVDTLVEKRRVDGEHIVSTIDTRFQDIAEHSLRQTLERFGGERGCAILMEVETGYVLACANIALDTSGRYCEVQDENVAVSRYYEPGSTFKSVAMMAMLSDPDRKFDTTTKVQSVYKEYPNAKPVKDSHKKHDSLSVKEVIEESSNVGMCELAWKYYRNRRDDFVKLIRQVFPYEQLNLDVKAGEPRCHINNVNASNNDFLRLAFGYSTVVTPMQIVTFYNAVAGGGRMVKPLFCRAIVDRKGRRRDIAPVVLREQAFSRENAKLLTEMLIGVVERGTAKGIKTDLYAIAGKTGTANYRVSLPEWHNSSFAGFFPAENPRYTCYVMLEKVPRVAFGTQAAKVFKEIANCVVAIDGRLNEGVLRTSLPQLEKDSTRALEVPSLEKGCQDAIARAYALVGRSYRYTENSSRWVYYKTDSETSTGGYEEYYPTRGRVPNCYGMTAKDAVKMLKELGYRVHVSGYGKVRSQIPKGGVTAPKGSRVSLTLGN